MPITRKFWEKKSSMGTRLITININLFYELKCKNCGISIGIDKPVKYSRKSRKNSRYIYELSNVKKGGISHQYQKNMMMKQLYLKNN